MAKSSYKGMSKRQIEEINLKGYGKEPIFVGAMTSSDMLFALNWYNTMSDQSECKEFLVEYYSTKNSKLAQKIKKVPSIYDVKTYGWIARLCTNGATFDSGLYARMDKAVTKLVAANTSTKKSENNDTKKNTVNIQDKIRERSYDIIGDIEAMIDNGDIEKVYDYLKENQIPAIYGSKIVEYYTPILNEIQVAVSGKDKTVKEAYSTYKVKQLKTLLSDYKSLIGQVERFTENVKVAKPRKPRKKKSVPAVKKVTSLKYLKDHTELKISSVDPTKIVGATEVWLFNTTNNMLTKLVSRTANGFDVKGTSILNVDIDNSIGKRVGRKAEEVIAVVLKGGKIKLRKVFDMVNAKEVIPTNRTNDATVILKVNK